MLQPGLTDCSMLESHTSTRQIQSFFYRFSKLELKLNYNLLICLVFICKPISESALKVEQVEGKLLDAERERKRERGRSRGREWRHLHMNGQSCLKRLRLKQLHAVDTIDIYYR